MTTHVEESHGTLAILSLCLQFHPSTMIWNMQSGWEAGPHTSFSLSLCLPLFRRWSETGIYPSQLPRYQELWCWCTCITRLYDLVSLIAPFHTPWFLCLVAFFLPSSFGYDHNLLFSLGFYSLLSTSHYSFLWPFPFLIPFLTLQT